MSDTPYFSIIIPMYNVEKYIKICINSILAQTLQDFEVIIVDDCSTDNSYNICRQLYGNNKKIRLLQHEKNQGQGPARNLGIKKARGKYIWFIDSDDAILPNALEKLYKVLQTEKDIDAVHLKGWFRTMQDDDKPLNLSRITIEWESPKYVGFLPQDIPRRLAENWAVKRMFGGVCCTIYRRQFLFENEIEFPNFNCHAEDQVLHLAGICFAKKYLIIPESLYIYRLRKGSYTKSANVSLGLNSMQIVEREMQKILNKVPSLNDHRILKEQCIIKTLEATFRDHARPLYNGVNIPTELDQAVYETLLPIFGENTTLVKYLFHGFNTMWRQANTLAQQNHLLRQNNALIQQQQKLLEQISNLISSNRNVIQQNNLLANQNKMLEQMKGLLEQHNRKLNQSQK